MKKILVVATLAAALSAAPAPASAQEAAPIDSAFHADILELLEVTNAAKLGVQMGATISEMTLQQIRSAHPDMPERFIAIARQEILTLLGSELDTLMDRIVPVYARYLTQEDVRGLIVFYRSDLGRKTIRVMPAIVQDGMELGQAWGQEVTPKLMQAIEQRLEEEGYLPKQDG